MFVARKTSRIIGRATQFSVSSETRIKKKKKRIKPTYIHSAFNKRKTVLRTRVHLNVIIIFDDPCYVSLYCAHMVCFVEMADDGRAHLDPKNVPTLQCRARGTFVAPYENVSPPPARSWAHTLVYNICTAKRPSVVRKHGAFKQLLCTGGRLYSVLKTSNKPRTTPGDRRRSRTATGWCAL